MYLEEILLFIRNRMLLSELFRYHKFRHFDYKLIDCYRFKKKRRPEVFDFEILCPELLKAQLTLLAPCLTIFYGVQVCHRNYRPH